MRLKRKHKKRLAFISIGLGLVLFAVGAYRVNTLPPDPPMSADDWYERATDRQRTEFYGYVMMGLGGFMNIVAIQELFRQATKLKV